VRNVHRKQGRQDNRVLLSSSLTLCLETAAVHVQIINDSAFLLSCDKRPKPVVPGRDDEEHSMSKVFTL
jgi:hypothetical protein